MKKIFYIIFIALVWSTEGCTDPMAFNCMDDQDYESYIINVQGVVYDNSCNWSWDYEFEDYIDDNNCDFLNIPNDNDFACTGYYNPQATIDDGSCRYPQAPSDEDVFFTILSEDEIYIDWSGFQAPDNAVFQSIHIQRCTEESCSWVNGAGNLDTFTGTNIIDIHEWELDSPIKYLFAVKYASNTYWGQAIDYTYLTPTEGCTDSDASNFNPDANVDDGSCIIEGCTDPDASNFDPDANVDDGSCILLESDFDRINSFTLNKVFPNPFNSNVSIDFSLEYYDYISIDIVNINGSIVDRLINDYIISGNYIAHWDASSFPTGIYFVRIISNQTKTRYLKKIIYLK